MAETESTVTVSFTVNGTPVTCAVEPRRSLLDCIREDLHLHGTHVGCEHGVCGCCNVWVDGELVRACLMLAFQADGTEITTIEGIEGPGGSLSPMQEAFCAHHGLQCGYCTPGMIMTLENLVKENPAPTEDDLIDAVSGNLCRCTGYHQLLEAARSVIAANTNHG
jgi:aerobic carbon-monoxide dehydrogenase small subunit